MSRHSRCNLSSLTKMFYTFEGGCNIAGAEAVWVGDIGYAALHFHPNMMCHDHFNDKGIHHPPSVT